MKNFLAPIIGIIIALAIIWGIVWYMGSSNPTVPAGYVGYLVQNSWFGHAKFVGLLKGPASPGKTWLLNSTNVSITPYTYTEEFSGSNKVLSKDNLLIGYRMHIFWKIDETKVKEFVEKFSTLDDDANPQKIVKVVYNNYLKEQFRTFSRNEVQKYNALDIKDNILPIGNAVFKEMQNLSENTPFIIINVTVGNVQYPNEVSTAVSKKLAATQLLEQKVTDLKIAQKNAQIKIAEAEGIAKSMDIVQQKLTPLYIQHEAIEAQKSMADSKNNTMIYIPVGPNGVPVVGNMDLMPKK